MKTILQLTLLLATAHLFSQSTISGIVKNKDAKTISFYSDNRLLGAEKELIQKINLDSSGGFEVSFNFLDNQIITISSDEVTKSFGKGKQTLTYFPSSKVHIRTSEEYYLELDESFNLQKIESNDNTNQLYNECKKQLMFGKMNKKSMKVVLDKYQDLLRKYSGEKEFDDYAKYELLNNNIRAFQKILPEKLKWIEDSVLSTKVAIQNKSYQRLINQMYVKREAADFITPKELKTRMENLENESLKELALIMLHANNVNLKFRNYEEEISSLREISNQTKSSEIKSLANYAISFHEASLEGQIVENFSFRTDQNDIIKISDFRGQYLVLDFWATWCGPCVQQMKKLPSLKEKYSEKVDFLCISRDFSEDLMKKFIDKHDYGTLLFSFNGIDKELISYFNVQAIPRYIIIDPEGRIAKYRITEGIEMELASLIE